MKSRIARVAALTALLALGCTQDLPTKIPSQKSVITGHAVYAEAARAVLGDRGHARDLKPDYGHAHDLELTTGRLDDVRNADFFVYAGAKFQPSIAEALLNIDTPVVDTSTLDDNPDPHLWLDPIAFASVVSMIEGEATKLHPEHASEFADNALKYAQTIAEVDESYRERLVDCPRKTIITAHDAFGRLAERYGLRAEPIEGAEGEANPARIDELTALIKTEGLTHVFSEPQPDTEHSEAETLANNASVKTAVLDPIEYLVSGATWESSMRSNLEVLSVALDCRNALNPS